jgi:hypothetical protein
VNGYINTGKQRVEPRRGRIGDEQFPRRAATQRGLDEIGTLGEEPAGSFAADMAVQLRRGGYSRRAFGERLARSQSQAASPAVGALTSSGSAAFATPTSAVNAAGSLIAISERFLRSTSTPAAFRPWINRL